MHAVACLFSRLCDIQRFKGAIRDFIHCQIYGDEKNCCVKLQLCYFIGLFLQHFSILVIT